MNEKFTNAINRVEQSCPPIWMMRQAGKPGGSFSKSGGSNSRSTTSKARSTGNNNLKSAGNSANKPYNKKKGSKPKTSWKKN